MPDIEMISTENEEIPPLIERISSQVAESSAVLKSQQINEPDLNVKERQQIAKDLLTTKPGQFLYRFGKYLKNEHLQHFVQFSSDFEVNFYLKETQKLLNKHTSSVKIKNRRYIALQKLQKSGDYFSEKEMKSRNPLLYSQLVAQHMTEDEKVKLDVDRGDCSLSSMLLKHTDLQDENERKKIQEEIEDDMLEEGDSDEEDDDEDTKMQQPVCSDEKILLKNEFFSSMYNNFLDGKDGEFDYSKIDESEDYDSLGLEGQDEEERYFDEEEPLSCHSDLSSNSYGSINKTPYSTPIDEG